jgi:hypothetical protein
LLQVWGEERGTQGFGYVRGHFEDKGVNGRIILDWIFKKWPGSAWSELIWLSIGICGNCCKNGNTPLDSTQCEKFFDYLTKDIFLNNDSSL